jgi:PqqD family protein of HPr-rel-A system
VNETLRLTAATVVVASGDQLASELGGEAVVLDLASGTYYGLNETGARIWSLLESPITVGDVCRHLRQEFDVGADECEQAVVQLLQQLVTAGLVEVKH